MGSEEHASLLSARSTTRRPRSSGGLAGCVEDEVRESSAQDGCARGGLMSGIAIPFSEALRVHCELQRGSFVHVRLGRAAGSAPLQIVKRHVAEAKFPVPARLRAGALV